MNKNYNRKALFFECPKTNYELVIKIFPVNERQNKEFSKVLVVEDNKTISR